MTQLNFFDCRRRAYQSLAPEAAKRMLDEVEDFIRERGPHGATDEEIGLALRLQADTSRARRCELRDNGKIVDSGRRRPTHSGRLATVWTLPRYRQVDGPADGELAAAGMPGRPKPAAIADGKPAAVPAESAPVISQEMEAGAAAWEAPTEPRPAAAPGMRCRCGCAETVEVPIAGNRTRLDCAGCGRFVRFGKWWPTARTEA